MSFDQNPIAWSLNLPTTEKFVLLCIVDTINEKQRVGWPSVEYIRRRTRYSERAIRNAISMLQARGVLSVVRRPRNTNLYSLIPKEPCTTCTSDPDGTLHGVHPDPAPDAPLPCTPCTRNLEGNLEGNQEEQEALVAADATTPESLALTIPARAAPKLTPRDLGELWNLHAHPDLPKVSKIANGRADKVRSRLREHDDPDFWRAIIGRISASPFCRGATGGTWRANFDWMISSEDVLTKIEEGRYDDTKPAVKAPVSKWAGAVMGAMENLQKKEARNGRAGVVVDHETGLPYLSAPRND